MHCSRITSLVALILAGGLVLVGCQDSFLNTSPEDARTSGAPSVEKTQRANGLGRCDAEVHSGETIQGAVNAASPGDVICVTPGTYREQIRIDESVTVRGQTPATSGNPVVIEGWVSIEADRSTLRRVVVTRDDPFTTPGSFTPDPFGIRVTASDVLVAENVVQGIDDNVELGSINGIQVFGEDPLSNITIRDNIVRDYRNSDDQGNPVFGVAGIKVQADVSTVEVIGNEVRDLHSLFGFGVVLTTSRSADGVPKNVLVEENTLEGINDGTVFDVFRGPNGGRTAAPYPGTAVGIEADAEEVIVRRNNLLAPNGAENKDQDDPLVAECNWWGHMSGPINDKNPSGEGTWALGRGAAAIEFTPWLNAPAPSNACVGGEKPGNGGGPGHGHRGAGP